MWIEHLSEKDSHRIFGRNADVIISLSRAAAQKKSLVIPAQINLSVSEGELVKRYGFNGVAVWLFMQNWREVPWRKNEGGSVKGEQENDFMQLLSWEEAIRPANKGKKWIAALKLSGIESRDKSDWLGNVWEDAGKIGGEVGSHNARILAGATCGELAQIDKDIHFFLDLMPYLWMGHWPCGWDDKRNMPYIF